MPTYTLPIRKLDSYSVKLPGTFKQVDVHTSTGLSVSQEMPDEIPVDLFKTREIAGEVYYEGSTMIPIQLGNGQMMPHVLRFEIEAASVAEAFERFDAAAMGAARDFFAEHAQPKIQVAKPSDVQGIILP
ncbi:MAG: hypothetical protein HC888_04780 [Candidatus Competibacteraceae bacterium]|nr:hypothetical protein [Candidatus Competibacteraceae bacterium]